MPAAACATALYYDGSLDKHGAAALANLGFTFTTVTTDAEFQTQLASATWQVVVIERYNNSISPASATALGSYIAGGGRVVCSYWAVSDPTALSLREAFGVAAAFDQGASVEPAHPWLPSSPVFTTHHAMGVVVPSPPYNWTDNGDRLQIAAGATALAGYTSMPNAAQVAIVQANAGRTIFNGFLFDNVEPGTATRLLENEIRAVVPEPLCLAMLIAAAPLLARRHRK